MGLDGFGKFIKFTMFGANFIIFLGGIAVLGVGIWTCTDTTSFNNLVGSDLYLSAAYILIITGCIVIVISFMGCFGAFKEIKCLLVAYFITLLLIFIIMIVGGILGFVFKAEVEESMINTMSNTMDSYMTSKDTQQLWNSLHRKFECCGLPNNKTEPYKAWRARFKSDFVPKTCCQKIPNTDKLMVEDCDSTVGSTWYTKDCYKELKAAVMEHAKAIAGVGIGIACILIIGMIFSILLCCMIE